MGAGQVVYAALRLLRQLVHGLAAGIGQPQHASRLVKALAGGIVPRGAEDLHVRVILYVHDEGVASGDGQRQKRRLKLRKSYVIGGDVAADVVHGDQRDAQTVRHALGKAHRHQHGADKPRGIGHGHGVNVFFRQSRA